MHWLSKAGATAAVWLAADVTVDLEGDGATVSAYSYFHDASEGIATRLAEATPERERLAQYSRWDDRGPECVRNPLCWAADLDLSFINSGSIKNGQWSREGCATLITPLHVVMAHHSHYEEGTIVVFTTRRNERVERRLTKVLRVGNSDIAIGLLEAEIAEAQIRPVAIAPPEWFAIRSEYSDTVKMETRWGGVPLLCSSRDRYCTVEVITGLSKTLRVARAASVSVLAADRAARWDRFFLQPISGTSGSPLLAVVGGEAILFGHFTTASPETGPFYPFWLSELLRSLKELGAPGTPRRPAARR